MKSSGNLQFESIKHSVETNENFKTHMNFESQLLKRFGNAPVEMAPRVNDEQLRHDSP